MCNIHITSVATCLASWPCVCHVPNDIHTHTLLFSHVNLKMPYQFTVILKHAGRQAGRHCASMLLMLRTSDDSIMPERITYSYILHTYIIHFLSFKRYKCQLHNTIFNSYIAEHKIIFVDLPGECPSTFLHLSQKGYYYSSSTSTSAFKHKLQQHSAYTFCSTVQDMRQNNRTNTYLNTIY